MKPTQEQIKAALQTSDEYERRCGGYHPSSPLIILAAAYRELLEKNNRLKLWADLAISTNALLAIDKLKAHEPR
jgi:hypothetical protein